MLVVAAALIRFNCVHSRGSNEEQFNSEHLAKIFSEDDMTPDFTEQLGSHDHTTDIKKRNDVGNEAKYGQPQNEARSTTKPVAEKPVKHSTARNLSEPNALRHNTPGRNTSGRPEEGVKRHILHEEIDVVDREDHVTQYLSDLLINTDSEITSLQASEVEDEREDRDSVEVKEDSFFAFLTGLEKAVDIDGAWSRPVYDVLLPNSELQEVNVGSDMEYKY